MRLRSTTPDDLDFVLALEHRDDNREFIGQWTREAHLETMARPDRAHLVIESPGAEPLGYLIAYDVRDEGYGLYIKRIAVGARSRGTGRAALSQFAARAWDEYHAALVCLAVRPHNVRAQRCYLASGFEEWTPTLPARAEFFARVDPAASECLLMRLLPARRD